MDAITNKRFSADLNTIFTLQLLSNHFILAKL